MKQKQTGWMLVCVLLFASAAVFAGGSPEEPEPVTTANRVEAAEHWTVAWNFNDEMVEFTLTAPTTGWVSIGFNPSARMADASYIIGYVEDGDVYLREDYGTGRTSHASDVSLGGTDDVQVISGTESDGITTLSFAVPRDSGDEYDTVLTPGETYTLLMAYGPDGSNNFTARHSQRTALEVEL